MKASSATHPSSLAVSVVSHGHGQLVGRLLQDLARFSGASINRVVLTLNVPEDEAFLAQSARELPFVLQLRRNQRPLGFGENHNRALDGAGESSVGVLNPDIRLVDADPFESMARAAQRPGVGCAYPLQFDEAGRLEDSERALPTPGALWRRRVLGRTDRRVDWVNAACLVLPTSAWRGVGGFDERYFMYCEDVDLCLRLRLKGLALVQAQGRVLHTGQRASHRKPTHLAWHIRSLFRLWRSPVYREAQQLLTSPSSGAGTIGTP